MSRRAWAYVLFVQIVGLSVAVVAFSGWSRAGADWIVFAILATMATVGQVWSARAPGHQSYHPAILFYFAGVLLLPPPLFVLLIVTPHILEWLRERVTNSQRLRNWYLQPFNIANHLISGTMARIAITALLPNQPSAMTATAAAVTVVGSVAYVISNHALTGQAIVLARGVGWKESGILDSENLLIDLIMVLLGEVFAFLYNVNRVLIIPALSPIVLIYRALMVPQLMKDAQTDSKTGLLNARHFVKLFAEEMERARRFGRPLSVIMSDLDLLRNVNNTYGHLAGDIVLGRLGEIIRSSVRKYDLAGRFGGEEFVIALPEVGPEGAKAFAERLRQAVEQTDVVVDTSPTPIRVTISLGVASYPGDGSDGTQLIHEADIAVYRAKLAGRNCVVHTSEIPHAERSFPQAIPERIEHPYVSSYTHIPRQVPTVDRSRGSETGVERAMLAEAGDSLSAQAQPAPVDDVRIPMSLMFTIAGVVLLAVAVGVWGFLGISHLDWVAIAAFGLLALIAESLQIDIYGDSTISVATSLNFAAALVAGLPGVVIIGGLIAVVHYFRKRPPLYKTLYNWSIHILSGACPVVIFGALGMPLSFDRALLLLVPAVPASLAYYAIESGLVTIAVGLSQQRNLLKTWRQNYRWLLGHYIGLCMVGLMLSVAYAALGLAGVFIFMVPVLMMRFSQTQYVKQTKRSVEELKRLNRELSRANEETVEANRASRHLNEELFATMAKINDARDPIVAGHSAKVAEYATILATELGLSDERVERVRQAAFLHDIGKVAISEQVLQKPGPLGPEEYTYMQRHAELGADFIETCQGLRHLASIVRHHHERWDGTGYPAGLEGAEIPLESRIISVCDTVEAMASDRPYRGAFSLEQIKEELEGSAGSQLDPAATAAFLRLLQLLGSDLIVNSADEVRKQAIRYRRNPALGTALYDARSTGKEEAVWN